MDQSEKDPDPGMWRSQPRENLLDLRSRFSVTRTTHPSTRGPQHPDYEFTFSRPRVVTCSTTDVPRPPDVLTILDLGSYTSWPQDTPTSIHTRGRWRPNPKPHVSRPRDMPLDSRSYFSIQSRFFSTQGQLFSTQKLRNCPSNPRRTTQPTNHTIFQTKPIQTKDLDLIQPRPCQDK